jgi:hypothetical protein
VSENEQQYPPGSTVLIMTATAEAEVTKAADITPEKE